MYAMQTGVPAGDISQGLAILLLVLVGTLAYLTVNMKSVLNLFLFGLTMVFLPLWAIGIIPLRLVFLLIIVNFLGIAMGEIVREGFQ
jgi:hypothetical protein